MDDWLEFIGILRKMIHQMLFRKMGNYAHLAAFVGVGVDDDDFDYSLDVALQN